MNRIYTVEDEGTKGVFKEYKLEEASKVDGHLHSRYSGRFPDLFLQSSITKLVGVRESYNELENIHSKLLKRGMSFCTVSDHDSVIGALRMRRDHPEDTLVNCEYTVRVGEDGQIIHVGVWGLDYPGEVSHPSTIHEVIDLHHELLKFGKEKERTYEGFVDFCEKAKLGYALNHPAWQGTPQKPFSGKQFDDIADAFPVFEINGDMQLENLIALEIAIEKKKAICAGSDSHSSIRLGTTYTATLNPVPTPFSFMQEFKKRKMGIGSLYALPGHVQNPSIEEIVRHKFNGSVADFRNDIYLVMGSYLLKDWSLRKVASVSTFLLIPSVLSYLLGPSITVPPLLAIEGFLFAAVPFGMAQIEKKSLAKRARKLYKDYVEHRAVQDYIRGLLENKELNDDAKKKSLEHVIDLVREHTELKTRTEKFDTVELMKEPHWWERFVYRLMSPIRLFHAEYDLNDTPRIDSKEIIQAEVEK